ncbi:substrate-binding domain-containing protein [Roseibacillus persicicus]|uniref:sugar ABC transporter substrate-binding protein n=1 Tax=Roseibacillus persicicus TaxID=454148 RepID=UPI00398B7127
MKVDFVPFLPPGLHPGMDALARGLARGVSERGGELRLRTGPMGESVRASIGEGVDAIYLFVTDPLEAEEEVKEALAEGIRVMTFHRPAYEVTASVLVPNFYQGVELATQLARRLEKRARVAILGGPEILDDEELVLGCLDGARRAGLEVLNDPFASQYRNLEDVKGVSGAVVERLMGDLYPFDGLIVFNDETLHDVVAYLKEKSLSGSFPIVSRNGSPAAIESIRQGLSTATLDYHLPEIGALGAGLLDGGEALVMAPAGQVYNSSNLEKAISWEVRAPFDISLNVIS